MWTPKKKSCVSERANPTVRRVWFGALLAIAMAACGGNHPTQPDSATGLTSIASTGEWPSASSTAEGLDASRLEDLVLRIRQGKYGRIHSLLIARHQRLVVEEYFNGWSAEQPHTMQSVTKSVTALLTGLAAQSGQLRLDDRATSFFQDYQPLANDDARKSALTVADLMTMRSGFDWDETDYGGSPLQQLSDCGCDWVRFMLDWRMRDAPGTRWEYVSGATILLGAIVGRATGSRLDLFASTTLFAPLGIRGEYWTRGLPDGLPHAAGGLYLRPRDMAKIGAVMLDGSWQGRRVLDGHLIPQLTTRLTRNARTFSGHSFDYGYGWWMTDNDVIAAAGVGGQWIFVVPPLSLVVAVTGDNGDAWTAPVDFLYSHVLPTGRQPH